MGRLAGSVKVQSKHFQAALHRVPPSLTRGVQMLSETGKLPVLRMHTPSDSFDQRLQERQTIFASTEVMHLPE